MKKHNAKEIGLSNKEKPSSTSWTIRPNLWLRHICRFWCWSVLAIVSRVLKFLRLRWVWCLKHSEMIHFMIQTIYRLLYWNLWKVTNRGILPISLWNIWNIVSASVCYSLGVVRWIALIAWKRVSVLLFHTVDLKWIMMWMQWKK